MVESDLIITEGSTREIFVKRQQNNTFTMSLTVFVTTIEGYKSRQRMQTDCNITLSTLLGNTESPVDPAEGIIMCIPVLSCKIIQYHVLYKLCDFLENVGIQGDMIP